MSIAQVERGMAAALENQRRGLKPLKGTEKQCAWGETVRAGKFRAVEQLIRAAQERKDRNGAAELTQWAKRLRLETGARFWIDARETDAADLLWNARGI